MSKKRDEKRGKTVLEYTIVETPNLKTGKKTKVPRIANMKTNMMSSLIKRAKATGQFHSSEISFEADFHIMMSIVRETLEKGEAVNLGGYLRLEPCLKGTVNKKGLITEENELAIKVRALKNLKLELHDFAWRLKGDRVKVL